MVASTEEKKVSFEESMERLEIIVSKLEAGDLSLDKSLEAFEEGRKLVSQCNSALKDAEMRVEKLMKKEESKA